MISLIGDADAFLELVEHHSNALTAFESSRGILATQGSVPFDALAMFH